VDAVLSRQMPPAQFDPSCRRVARDHWMTDHDLSLFEHWASDGHLEGSPEPTEQILIDSYAEGTLGPPHLVLRLPQPYVPEWGYGMGDANVFLSYDYVVSEELVVTAVQLVPSEPRITHHALVYVEDGDDSIGKPIAAYVPGLGPFTFPAGAALLLPQGSTFALSVHLQAGYLEPDEEIDGVDLDLLFWLAAPDEAISHEVHISYAWTGDLFIAADDPESVQQGSTVLPEHAGAVVFGVIPHTHFLGTSVRAEMRMEDGSDECLLHEPFYDPHWQTLHRFVEEDYVYRAGGESVTITCVYDNSQENQPFLSGQQVRTRDVESGPEALDEMCQVAILEAVPR
jgi:hypothetical protein